MRPSLRTGTATGLAALLGTIGCASVPIGTERSTESDASIPEDASSDREFDPSTIPETNDARWATVRIEGSGTGELASIPYEIRDDMAMAGGDMILGPAAQMEPTAAFPRLGRRWTNGIVPFEYRDLSPDARARADAAMEQWARATSIRFVPHTEEPNFVVFNGGGAGCNSHVGMIGGAQNINLSSGCTAEGAVHEVGHALGLFHEHQRRDRDDHIRFFRENVAPGTDISVTFAKLPILGVTNGSPYDTRSIMHYASSAFARPGTSTLLTVYGQQISSPTRISIGDMDGMNWRYGPPPIRRLSGDFDGNGSMDILEIRSGEFWLATSSQGQLFPFNLWGRFPDWRDVLAPDSEARTLVGDFDGDGRDELLFTWIDGTCWVIDFYTESGIAHSLFAHVPGWGGVFAKNSPARMFVGNFDGDPAQRDDILFTWNDGTWWVGTSNGTSLSFALWHHEAGWGGVIAAGSAARTFVGDFDGDRRDDFLFTWNDGTWWVGRSTGTGFAFGLWRHVPGWGGVIDAGSVARTFVDDFTGDGRDDFMFTWNDGNWWVGTSTGSAFEFGLWASQPTWGGMMNATSDARVYAFDVNRDRRTDVLMIAPDGNWYVAITNPTGTALLPFSSWAYYPQWAQFTHARAGTEVLAGENGYPGISVYRGTYYDWMTMRFPHNPNLVSPSFIEGVR